MGVYNLFGVSLRVDEALPGASELPRSTSFDVDVKLGAFPYDVTHVRGTRVVERRSIDATSTAWVERTASRGDYWIHYDDEIEFLVSARGDSIWARWPAPFTQHDAIVYLPGGPLALALRLQGRHVLHASVVAADGDAIGFLGSGGSGKSTLAAIWALSGMRVVSDDLLVLRRGDEHFLAEPGSSHLRLWPDSDAGLRGSTEAALPEIVSGWDKRFLDLDALGLYAHEALRLRALYILAGVSDSLPSAKIEATSGRRALMGLIANCHTARYTGPSTSHEDFAAMTSLQARVPIKRLAMPSKWEASRGAPDVILADVARMTD